MVDIQQVLGILRRDDSQRSQERKIPTQVGVERGCTTGKPFFRIDVLSPDVLFDRAVSSVRVDVVLYQGQCPQPLALTL